MLALLFVPWREYMCELSLCAMPRFPSSYHSSDVQI
jgi:hypothetical protein